MKVRFPDGREIFIEPIVRTKAPARDAAKPIRLEVRKQACKHVGKAIDVVQSCKGGIAGGIWECDVPAIGKCAPLSLHVVHNGMPCARCELYEPAPEPGLARLGLNLASAVAKWIKAGRPVRTQERVDELLAICRACPFLNRTNPNREFCTKCGCRVNGDAANPTTNKLAMATESCPLDPPRWTKEK